MTPHVSIDDILQAVQRVTKVTVRELKSIDQTPRVREARVLAYFVANQCFDKFPSEIARVMGRNRKTVQSTVNEACAYTRFDPGLVDRVEDTAEAFYRGRLQAATSLEDRA